MRALVHVPLQGCRCIPQYTLTALRRQEYQTVGMAPYAEEIARNFFSSEVQVLLPVYTLEG
jgi:hypothetical protein